jgi:hypothetical protein
MPIMLDEKPAVRREHRGKGKICTHRIFHCGLRVRSLFNG